MTNQMRKPTMATKKPNPKTQLNGSIGLLANALHEVVTEAIAVGNSGMSKKLDAMDEKIDSNNKELRGDIKELATKIDGLEKSNTEVWKYLATDGKQGKLPAGVKGRK